jgi:hypothetical protein
MPWKRVCLGHSDQAPSPRSLRLCGQAGTRTLANPHSLKLHVLLKPQLRVRSLHKVFAYRLLSCATILSTQQNRRPLHVYVMTHRDTVSPINYRSAGWCTICDPIFLLFGSAPTASALRKGQQIHWLCPALLSKGTFFRPMSGPITETDAGSLFSARLLQEKGVYCL